MPNGIETSAIIRYRDTVAIGDGLLEAGGQTVSAGRIWEAIPEARARLDFDDPFTPDASQLLGRGDGLTPAGDDLLVGYIAARALYHDERPDSGLLAGLAGHATTRLSTTLLHHARSGALPEPAHRLVEDGAIGPLLQFGQSSGKWIAIGIFLGASTAEVTRCWAPDDLSVGSANRLLARCYPNRA
jgi:hypothetical protein